MKYAVATNATERNQAIELVHKVYVEQGYLAPDAPTNNSKHFLHRPEAKTILCKNPSLVGTISLVLDQHGNLPMEQIYAEELKTLRTDRRQLAEVCQFAVLKTGRQTNLDVSLGLLSHAIHLALKETVDCLCFTINPKHQLFYRSLGCHQIGSEKPYPFVNNAPALAFFLDLTTVTAMEQPRQKSLILKKILSQTPQQSFFTH